jgi:hypothetical protein
MENSIIIVIIDSIVVFILCNVPRLQYVTSFSSEANDLSNQHMCDLFKQRFVSCMFYVFNCVPKISDLTSNITNLIFIKSVAML